MNKFSILIGLVVLLLLSCDDTTSPIIPNIPYNLNIEILDHSHINLSWQLNSSTVGDTIQYTVAKKIGTEEWDENYFYVLENKNVMDLIDTSDSLIYAYKVRATNLSTNTSYPFSNSIAYFSDLTTPSDLNLYQPNQNQILLTWKDHCIGEEGYIIDKKTSDGAWISPYAKLTENTVSYLDQTDLFENVQYRIYAFMGSSNSRSISSEIFTSLGAPSNLELSKPDFNKIRLDWIDNSLGEDGFYIDRKLGKLPWQTQYATVDSNKIFFIDDVDFPAATLQYRIYAYQGEYTSNYSNADTINIHLELIGSYTTDGDALDVKVKNLIAYIADNYNGIEVVSCLNPDDPEQITNIPIPDRALDSSLEDNFLYVVSNSGDSPGLLSKIDLSNYLNPQYVGSADIDGIPNSISTSGDHAYIAAGSDGLLVAYITSMNPAIVTNISTGGIARKITIDGFYAYVTNGLDGFSIFDISSPSNPEMISSFPSTGLANNIAVNNGIACITNGEDGADIFDVNNPNNPIFITNFPGEGFIYDVAIQENYIYLIDKNKGVIILDVSDINNPYQIGNFSMQTDPVSACNFGSYLFVTDNEGLKIIQVRP
jgi:hypothetical protein